MSGPPSARALTATRFSTLAGLWLVMLLSLPRYWLIHDESRLTLLAVLLVAVAVALGGFWRVMAGAERALCPKALRGLIISLVAGVLAMFAWQWSRGAPPPGIITLSQGAAFGLLIHVVARLWKRRR
ncbi:hypothetical protein [Salinicola rhizosphaerae]|uniref:Transmembrane protein n=1 Tax=Salinicola rhizosphaerae TaxID=1443141 RepID=A0ABQ3DSN5_9GAMM|nr:hypothetical protein [Salinicola rhizosphaerae]GHB09703.1 hypothetical protein GCM10009038_04170 [Salinicola rhizosphaerae]